MLKYYTLTSYSFEHHSFFTLSLDYATIGRDQIVQVLRHGGLVKG